MVIFCEGHRHKLYTQLNFLSLKNRIIIGNNPIIMGINTEGYHGIGRISRAYILKEYY